MRENYTHQGCTHPPGAHGILSMFPVSSATPVFLAVVCLMTTAYARLAVVATAMTKPFIMQGYCKRHGLAVGKAVDVACSGGESTRRLAARFPEAQLAGIDLSPHFLAVAELRRR